METPPHPPAPSRYKTEIASLGVPLGFVAFLIVAAVVCLFISFGMAMDGNFWGTRIAFSSRHYGGGIVYLGFALGGLGMAYRTVLYLAKKYALEIELRENSLWVKRLLGTEEFPWRGLKKAYGTDNTFVLQEHSGAEHNIEATFEDFDAFRREVQRRIAQSPR